MNVYISMVLFLLIGLFLFLALYDSGSTSSSSSSSLSLSTSTSLSTSDDDVDSPNIKMDLGPSGSLTTHELHFRSGYGNGVTGDLNVRNDGSGEGGGNVKANHFCIDGICLDKGNFKALSNITAGTVTGSFPSPSSGGTIAKNEDGDAIMLNAMLVTESGIRSGGATTGGDVFLRKFYDYEHQDYMWN